MAATAHLRMRYRARVRAFLRGARRWAAVFALPPNVRVAIYECRPQDLERHTTGTIALSS